MDSYIYLTYQTSTEFHPAAMPLETSLKLDPLSDAA